MLVDGVLVDPALEEAELVLSGVQAATVRVGRRRLEGDQELVIHGTFAAAAIDDVDRRRAWADAGRVGRPSANAGDQERGEHQGTCATQAVRAQRVRPTVHGPHVPTPLLNAADFLCEHVVCLESAGSLGRVVVHRAEGRRRSCRRPPGCEQISARAWGSFGRQGTV